MITETTQYLDDPDFVQLTNKSNSDMKSFLDTNKKFSDEKISRDSFNTQFNLSFNFDISDIKWEV